MIKASYTKRTLYFKQPAGTSRGVLTKKDSYFITLTDKENPSKQGTGEISPIPGLSIDDTSNLKNKIEEIVHLINNDRFDFNSSLHDFPSIQFGLEVAQLGMNISKPGILYPSDFTEGKIPIPINGLIWMGNKEFMKRQIEEKLNAGFRCVKLKIGAIDFEEELSILKNIREKYKPNKLELRVDANGAFDPQEAYTKLCRLAELEIHSIEQPIKHGQVEQMSELCATSPLPVALDEELIGISGKEEKRKLLETIKPQYIILKPTLLGGFKASEEWIKLANERGIGWWVTSTLESNLGLNVIAQWTATLNNKMYQGLGTGALYKNNVDSPLYLIGDKLYFSV